MTSNDVERLAAMFSDDLVYVHTSGTVDSKTSLLDRIRSGDLRYRSIETSDVRPRSYGDTAVITGKAQMVVTAGGSDRHLDIRYTSVCVEHGGRWQLASWQSTVAPAPPPDIGELESVWNAAHLRGDVDALGSLFADDIEIIVPGMQPLNKETALGVLRARHIKFDQYDTSDTRFRLYGDAAVVTGRLHRARIVDEKPSVDDWRFTRVYARRDGQWRVVSFQASPNAQ